MPNKTKILIIGLDAATLDLILPWIRQGHLPVIERLIHTGSYAKMKSVLPILSSAAWTTLMTGANPGKHGIFDFVYRDKKSYLLRTVTQTQNRLPTLWRLLSENHKRILVFNVPLTYPPEPINGIMVSGFITPDYKVFTYPPELSKELLEAGYQVNLRYSFPIVNTDEYLAATYERLNKNTEIALSLFQKEDWDLSIIVYRETDDIAHGFWHYMDSSHPNYIEDLSKKNTILEIYKKFDHIIGRFLEVSGTNTTTFIISDHGSGPIYKDVYLNEWLRQSGYLILNSPPFYRLILSQLGITRENTISFLTKHKMGRIVSIITDVFKDSLKTIPKSKQVDFHIGIDWEKTQAYSFGWNGQIYINQKGREPFGIVDPGSEYYKIREEICKKLTTIVDPEDGKPVVDQVYTRENLYHGEALPDAPDIIVTMRDYAYITRFGFELGNVKGRILSESMTRMYGGHQYYGTVIAAGPPIVPSNEERNDIWIGDLAPTILQIFGIPIPEWMDGKVLLDWLTTEFATKPLKSTSTFTDYHHPQSSFLSEEEERELLNRLKDLGYYG